MRRASSTDLHVNVKIAIVVPTRTSEVEDTAHIMPRRKLDVMQMQQQSCKAHRCYFKKKKRAPFRWVIGGVLMRRCTLLDVGES